MGEMPAPMNLYMWRSELLENYTRGYIVVVANDVAEATRMAKIACDTYIASKAEECCWDTESVEQAQASLARDLITQPTLLEAGILLVPGSD